MRKIFKFYKIPFKSIWGIVTGIECPSDLFYKLYDLFSKINSYLNNKKSIKFKIIDIDFSDNVRFYWIGGSEKIVNYLKNFEKSCKKEKDNLSLIIRKGGIYEQN